MDLLISTYGNYVGRYYLWLHNRRRGASARAHATNYRSPADSDGCLARDVVSMRLLGKHYFAQVTLRMYDTHDGNGLLIWQTIINHILALSDASVARPDLIALSSYAREAN